MSLGTALHAAACSHAPPADFAPDPGLVEQIRAIRILPRDGRACPGATIIANYEAVLADGSRLPFARSYDKKHPPRLHVVLLDRQSPDAVSRQDGDWRADRDPLATMSTGFRLTATLRTKPSVTSTVVVPPEYGCLPHMFMFSGAPGGAAGLRGSDGPDVTVRLALLRSPFYDKLYVAGIQLGGASPRYVLGDAGNAPAADWLTVGSQGGDGGAGLAGTNGIDGAPGAPGCPGQAGWPGSNGSNGGAGGSGGSGGHMTIVVPADRPFLAKWSRVAAGVERGDREGPVGGEVAAVGEAWGCWTRTISPAPPGATVRQAATERRASSAAPEPQGSARSSWRP